MKPRYIVVLIALMASSVAGAADTAERTSPLDNHAACMDRTVDASTGNCVVKDEGTPRRTYPPKPSPAVAGPAPAPVPTLPTVRKTTTSK